VVPSCISISERLDNCCVGNVAGHWTVFNIILTLDRYASMM
jgi:hypothetical protein